MHLNMIQSNKNIPTSRNEIKRARSISEIENGINLIKTLLYFQKK